MKDKNDINKKLESSEEKKKIESDNKHTDSKKKKTKSFSSKISFNDRK